MDMVKSLDKNNDDYTTPLDVWTNIQEYLPRDKVVWEAFYNEESKSPEHLRSLGCKVVYGNIDFYTSDVGDVIITNPPFSDKERVMERLAVLDKPFILTWPVHSLCTRFIKRLFKNKLQIIIPDYRIHFEKRDRDTGERRRLTRTPFDTCYVCYNMNLARDIIWL